MSEDTTLSWRTRAQAAAEPHTDADLPTFDRTQTADDHGSDLVESTGGELASTDTGQFPPVTDADLAEPMDLSSMQDSWSEAANDSHDAEDADDAEVAGDTEDTVAPAVESDGAADVSSEESVEDDTVATEGADESEFSTDTTILGTAAAPLVGADSLSAEGALDLEAAQQSDEDLDINETSVLALHTPEEDHSAWATSEAESAPEPVDDDALVAVSDTDAELSDNTEFVAAAATDDADDTHEAGVDTAVAGAAAAGAAAVTVGAANPQRYGPVRATMTVRRIDPWSTAKVSLMINILIFFAWMIAVGIIYLVLGGMGVWASLDSMASEFVSEGQAGVGALEVFSVAGVLGLINVVLLTAFMTVMAFVYNIVCDLVGGIHVTLADRD